MNGRLETVMISFLKMASLCAAMGLAACVTDEPRDAGGRIMSFSEPKALTADQTDLNIGAWLDPRMIAKVERTIRDNRGINEEISLRGPNNSGSGIIATQRVDDGFFSLATADAIDNAEKFKALVETRLKSSGVAAQETPAKIDHKRAYKTRLSPPWRETKATASSPKPAYVSVCSAPTPTNAARPTR